METKIKIVKEKIEIDANERAVNEKSQYCFFVCTTFDSFLNDLSISLNNKFHELTTLSKNSLQDSPLYLFLLVLTLQS